MRAPPPHWPSVAILLFISGCAPDGEFPSLAMREAERNLSFEEPERPPVTVARDPEVTARIQSLEHQAAEGNHAFEAMAPSVEDRVAAAGPGGSDAWVAAQEAVSRLEAARAPTTRALADLDRLRIDRAAMPTNAADFAAIEDAMDRIGRIAEAQRDRVQQFVARLAR